MRYRRAVEKIWILAEACENFSKRWRRENRGGGRYPEHELWEAVQGYLDLLDASQQ